MQMCEYESNDLLNRHTSYTLLVLMCSSGCRDKHFTKTSPYTTSLSFLERSCFPLILFSSLLSAFCLRTHYSQRALTWLSILKTWNSPLRSQPQTLLHNVLNHLIKPALTEIPLIKIKQQRWADRGKWETTVIMKRCECVGHRAKWTEIWINTVFIIQIWGSNTERN